MRAGLDGDAETGVGGWRCGMGDEKQSCFEFLCVRSLGDAEGCLSVK